MTTAERATGHTTETAVASVAEFEESDGWLPVSVGGEPWLLVRLDGEPAAVRDECPHRRVPLSAGARVETPAGQRISCRYHGWQFAGSGECSSIPALGDDAPVPRGMRVRAGSVRVRDGAIWLTP